MSDTAVPVRDAGLLLTTELHPSLSDPLLSSMNFLNEVTSRFPKALSLAADRPYEGFFDVEDIHHYLRTYCDYLRTRRGYDEQQVATSLMQYGRTNGIIHELIARHLHVDEGMDVDPDAIVVTNGCQEAMYLVLQALRTDPHDALLVVSPAYVGITGSARLAQMPVRTVTGGPDGVDLSDLVAVLERARAEGLRPRACYIVPDFANPTGIRMTLETRRELLRLATREGLLLLEDNSYGIYPLDTRRYPTLKSMDSDHSVIYLGSFAKSCFPGARVGYAVADQAVADPGLGLSYLADHLSKTKSMLSVNTSPIAQAVVAGKLLENDCSLVKANQREAAVYRDNLRRLLDGLEKRFPPEPPGGPRRVHWVPPEGGFFVALSVPFQVTDRLLERCAREYGVLWTPLHHFYDGSPTNQLRLSCSSLTPEELEEALDRLAEFVRSLLPPGDETTSCAGPD